MIKVRGIGGKTHVANARLCDTRGAVTICATRLKGDFSQPEAIDNDVNCTWCSTRAFLLEESKVA